jgi:hypothetical protein
MIKARRRPTGGGSDTEQNGKSAQRMSATTLTLFFNLVVSTDQFPRNIFDFFHAFRNA